MITIDFETYYAKDFSLSKMTTEEYIRSPRFQVIGVCVKRDDEPTQWYTGTHEDIKVALDKYDLPNQQVIAHNAAFDCAILSWVFGISPKLIIDTLSLVRPLTGLTVGGSLRAASEYFGLGKKGNEIYNTLGKRREDFTPDEMDAFAAYCVQDVQLTWKLYKKLKDTTIYQEVYLIDTIIRMFTEPVFELDKTILEKHLEDVLRKKQDLLDMVGHDNREAFMSNEKFAELLRAEGVEPPMKTSPATGKETYAFSKTDDGFRELLEHDNEKVQALAAARLGLKSTLEETRTQALLDIQSRGRLPIMLNYYGAANTGRTSGGERCNLQNLPRGGQLRYAMKAPEGYEVVACDSSNIEARMLAYIAGEEKLLKLFRNHEDVYSSFASAVYKRPINKHDNPKERFVGKTCILGLGYGTGHKKLQHTLKLGGNEVSLEEAKRIVDLYRSEYSHISSLWKECQQALARVYGGWSSVITTMNLEFNQDGIRLPNTLRIRYPELERTEGEIDYEYTYRNKRLRSKIYGAKMVENIVQALARIAVTEQMNLIRRHLDARNRRLDDGRIRRVVHFVHDEVVVIVPADEAEETQHMMEDIMSTPPTWAPELPIFCEASRGRSYGDAK